MQRQFTFFIFFGITLVALFSVQRFSHSGTDNEIVKARMASMKVIATNMKGLSKVSRGLLPFDVNEVKKMLAVIKSAAAETPILFEVNATDPTSEAASEIWENYQDFTDKAFVLESTAATLIASLKSVDGMTDAVRSLGATCKSCHSKYRN